MGLCLVAGAGLDGCMAHSTTSEAPPNDEAEQAYEQAVTELREHHRHHHRGGVTQLIVMSLDTLDVDAANSDQVGRLHGELHACMAPAGDVEKSLLMALGTALAGRPAKFDPARADAHVQAFVTGFAGESFDARSIGANANALLSTHGGNQMALFYETVTPLLTPEQRTTLAEHLREYASQQPTASTK